MKLQLLKYSYQKKYKNKKILKIIFRMDSSYLFIIIENFQNFEHYLLECCFKFDLAKGKYFYFYSLVFALAMQIITECFIIAINFVNLDL